MGISQLNKMASYKGFQFDRDNYSAPVVNVQDDYDLEPPQQEYDPQPTQQQARPRTAGSTRRTPAKGTPSRGRRSPLSEAEASRRSGDEGPVVLNEMDNRERERYLDFMIHHDFDFEQDENGEYVATFKTENEPEPEPVQQQHRPAPQRRPQSASSVARFSPKPQSRARPLSWLLRMIADIYDDRFVLYTTEILTAQDISDFESFSSFIFNFLAKKFGL